MSHTWPGNVRELRNVIERAVILTTESEITPKLLPGFEIETSLHGRQDPEPPPTRGNLDELVSGYEKRIVLGALERNHFNINRTADDLQVTRHALRYRMQRLNISNETGATDDE